MTRFGYTLMTEQSGPKELVDYAVSAERVGFDFEVSSDHYFPWLSSQGHAPYAWSVLGAVAHATERVELFTYVTCPTIRYHPAVVAQKAATLQILADGRFTLGVGSGENLNEHVVGKGWPTVKRRQQMLKEAIQIMRELFTGALEGRVLRGRLGPPLGRSGHRRSDRGGGVRRPLGRDVRSAGRPPDRRRTEQGSGGLLARGAQGDRAAG
jgi:G6PDH family F420-dependent oxidoreductase